MRSTAGFLSTIQAIATGPCKQSGFTTTRRLALSVAILMGMTLMPLAVDAAKEDAAKQNRYEPSQKRLRKDRNKSPEIKVELTAAGKALADKYATMLSTLQADIQKQLPQIDSTKQKALQEALAAQQLAEVKYEIEHTKWRRGYQNQVTGLQSKEEKLEDAPARVADAEMLLKNALAMPDNHQDKARAMEEAQKNLKKRKQYLKEFPESVAKAKAAVESAKQKEPELARQVEAAAKVLEQAKARTMQALEALGVDGLLASNALDAKLAQAVVISEATPYWLAVYAQQGPTKEKVIEQLLSDKPLMLQMLVADGPVWEKYGSAVEIYQAIQKASPRAKEGLFQRLALAVALEFAVPVIAESREADGEEPQYIDPIQRYLSYEKAYLADELDPGFAGLNTWALRMVVNGTEPIDIMDWGQKMLRNYRPDLITMADENWRYVKSVNTEINYTSTYQKLGWDRPDLQRYQNILANGGICGRRAWFGRFILRTFGVPTTARPQPGHATLVRWTAAGWVACLGGGWGAGSKSVRGYSTDLDFLASTQTREDEQAFMKVKRAQWIGIAFGENPQYFGYHKNLRRREMNKFASQSVDEIEVPEFWHCVALSKQDLIIKKLKAKALAAVGEDLGESNESAIREKVDTVEIPKAERRISVDAKGTIHIPAAACSQPINNTDVICFMPSNLGGMQLHYTRYGGADTFEYSFEAPKAGTYKLSARLVTPAPKQHLYLKANNAKERIDIALPYTVGMWEELKPVEIELKKGKNVLTFYRGHYFMRGVTIRDFKLTPVK